MTRSHWRFATAVGLLASGLMVNVSGAVAVAEPGSGAHGAGPSSHDSTHQSNPLGGIASAIGANLQSAKDALGAGHQTHSSSSSNSTGSANKSSLTTVVPRMMATAIRASAPITGVSDTRPTTTTAPTDATTPAATPDSTASDSTASNSTTTDSTASQDSTATDSTTSGSTASPVDVANVVTPLTTALATTTSQLTQAASTVVADAVVAPAAAAISTVAAGVQSVASAATATIPDVLTSIQTLLTSTTDAIVPVTQLPTDLVSMLGIPSASAQLGADSSSPFTLPTPLQTARPLTGDPGLASALSADAGRTAAPTATYEAGATSAVAAATSFSASAQVAPGDAVSEGLKAFFHSYGVLVIAASLSALLAAALPGLVALLIPTAAGVGVGYRQAKAGTTLRASDIARFAGSGPVGIVRSGSLITLRPRAASVASPDVASHSQHAA